MKKSKTNKNNRESSESFTSVNPSANEISRIIKSLQNPASSKQASKPTDSNILTNQQKSNYAENKDVFAGETNAGYYKECLENERMSSVYSEINAKTSLIESRFTTEIERIKTFITDKMVSYVKWGIGIVIAVISILIPGFMILLNNQTEKIESKIELIIEKRIAPIENELNTRKNRDSTTNQSNIRNGIKN